VSIPRRLWRIARNYAGTRGVEIGERAMGGLSDAARELEEFLNGSRSAPAPPPKNPPPPREHPLASHYRTLGVPVGSDLETVERAWRRLVLETHPDRFMHDPVRQKEANARLREINAAHEALEAALSPRTSRPA
jgi:DnaJ-domain-containing protein 1